MPIPESGEVRKSVRVPDSITEWSGSAVCLSAESGLGIAAESARLITELDFFVRVHLPAKVKRTETVPLKVQVFYYGDDDDDDDDECVSAQLQLRESTQFKRLNAHSGFHLCICKGQTVTKIFKISPMTLGDIEVTIEAISPNAKEGVCPENIKMSERVYHDIVRQKLNVDAEGFMQVKLA